MDLNIKLTKVGLELHLKVPLSKNVLAATRKAIMATIATLAAALAAPGLLELFSRLGQ